MTTESRFLEEHHTDIGLEEGDPSQDASLQEDDDTDSKSRTSSRVFKYGLLAPMSNQEMVNDILYRAHVLYNDLITVHQERRKAFWDLDTDEAKKNTAEASDLCVQRKDVRVRINEMKSSKPADVGTARADHLTRIKALQETGKALTERIEALWTTNKKIRSARKTDPEYQDACRELDKGYTKKNNAVRNASGLYWGTYNLVDMAARTAASTTKGLPHRKPWTGEGQMGVQLQKLPDQEQDAIMGAGSEHTLVRIAPVDPRAWDMSVPRGVRKKLQRTTLTMRVASETGKPVFVTWPMVMHRPFPKDALVSNVSVNRGKNADRDVWTVQVTVKTPGTVKLDTADVERAIGIDVGWRSTSDGGLRVAYWADTNGRHDELKLSAGLRKDFAYVQTKQGQRSENLDFLQKGLAEDFGDRNLLDPELREQIRYMLRWRSPRKFVRLYRRFGPIRSNPSDNTGVSNNKTSRMVDTDGDRMPEAAATRLDSWCRLDQHNWRTEFGVRLEAIRNRDNDYAVFAARLVAEYDLIVIEKFKLQNVSKKAKPEKKKADTSDDFAAMKNAAAGQRVEASPGRLRQALVNAARKTGTRIVEVPAHGTSCIHRECGKKTKLGIEQIQTCTVCGVVFDRDENAAMNILDRGMALLRDPVKFTEADLVKPPKPSRFAAKLARLAEAKRANGGDLPERIALSE